MSTEDLGRLIRRCLRRSDSIEIDGLGTFAKNDEGRIVFKGSGPRVFIAYAVEDVDAAERLFSQLRDRGCAPWLDREKLLPGQNWPRRIQDAIESADFFIPCFSTNSVTKRGGFQAELRYAMDCASRIPLDDVFMIPVRLDECTVPLKIQRETQYVDLFPDWERGMSRVEKIIGRQRRRVA